MSFVIPQLQKQYITSRFQITIDVKMDFIRQQIDVKMDFIRQQIDVKIQSFHINNLKSVIKNYPGKHDYFFHKEQRYLCI